MCPRGLFSHYKKLSRLVVCYKKDWATLLHFIYFCYLLLVTNYPITTTICYHLFQYLQRIPCWKPLIISFCSSLDSTLLLIERTKIDPLYLWVITSQRNWVIIKVLYRCLRRNLLSWRISRLGFVTLIVGEVSLHPLGNAHHYKPCKHCN